MWTDDLNAELLRCLCALTGVFIHDFTFQSKSATYMDVLHCSCKPRLSDHQRNRMWALSQNHEARLLKMMSLKKISPLSDTETADGQCWSCGWADGWVFTSPLFSAVFGSILCPSRKYLTVRIIFTFLADHQFSPVEKDFITDPLVALL